ncbi:hypothetical protein Sbal195_2520 [Shewanella baltica OS195]|uniref:Uncharacterized protein n=1 Tax=Shewanella baltica (strain OS195) TaxID=399599 RepID=A9L498_SHEB9|nr:hypothetical protein [Shewanella baltica]ABX49688.1 hypothetical protein Sbal195_2520 [Shewanella baltica OS195]ADT94674.1 hypothetical protein Sbal678_2522 [Shewanella baltica OS678]
MDMTNTDFNIIFKSEVVGVWVVKPDKSEKACLLAKLPSTATKRLRDGCKVELFICLSGKFAALSMMIHDSIDQPLLIPMAVRTTKELNGWLSLFDHNEISISIFDEFSALTMSGSAVLKIESNTALSENDLSAIKLPNSFDEMEETISSMCHAINPDYGTKLFREVKLTRSTLTLSLNPTLVISADESSVFNYDVNDQDEGATQEKNLYQQLQLHFEQEVYLSPQVEVGKKVRELIDVLVQTDNTALLFESKALCLNDSNEDSSYEKKVGKVNRHCMKALKQLEGAAKNYRKKHKLTNEFGNEIQRLSDKNIIGIIVISEFCPHKDWMKVHEELLKKSSINKMHIVVIDLVEFMKNIKISSHKKVPLSYLLMQRFKASIEHGTLNITSTDSSLPYH